MSHHINYLLIYDQVDLYTLKIMFKVKNKLLSKAIQELLKISDNLKENI